MFNLSSSRIISSLIRTKPIVEFEGFASLSDAEDKVSQNDIFEEETFMNHQQNTS